MFFQLNLKTQVYFQYKFFFAVCQVLYIAGYDEYRYGARHGRILIPSRDTQMVAPRGDKMALQKRRTYSYPIVVAVFVSILAVYQLLLAAARWQFGRSSETILREAVPSEIIRKGARLLTNRESRYFYPHDDRKFSIAYNKPPKTGSSTMITVLRDWAKETNRLFVNCRGERAYESNLYLSDCVPRHDDGEVVFGTHFYLNPIALSMIQRRLPSVRLLTTTRYPTHRMLSLYLETNKLNFTNVDNEVEQIAYEKGLQEFLTKFNPWSLYNYHTGSLRYKLCPLTNQEKMEIHELASRYDIVVNLNLRQESNVILKHFNLFQIPDVRTDSQINRRGASDFQLAPDTMELVKNMSCMETELHQALMLRMASLYEFITGEDCITHGTMDTVTTCLEQRELDSIKANRQT